MKLVIREAKEADLAQVLSLYAQPEIDDGKVLPLDEARLVFRRLADYPDYRLFVAEEKSAIVGSYALLIMDNLGHLGARSAVIEDVVVDPARQGTGIGKALMTHAFAECRAKGCYKVALSSAEKREQAHAFYESLGFERHGYSFLIEIKAEGSASEK
jgi:ribosomal protein S18 acetylase RimI-like enzyme